MYVKSFADGALSINTAAGFIHSLRYRGQELLTARVPLFTIGLRSPEGDLIRLSAADAQQCKEDLGSFTYSRFAKEISVTVAISGEWVDWHISVANQSDCQIEWIDFPQAVFAPLRQNGGPGQMLYPYNEGALVDDLARKERTFPYQEPEYPSLGAYAVFPNMICSQFMAYLTDDFGLYMAAEDPERGVKGIDLKPHEQGVMPQFRLYCGAHFGEDYACPYPIRWQFFNGGWQQAAELYRRWFENHLPQGLVKAAVNPHLSEWYSEPLLVVTYPVRGVHDMDEMTPNALYPYEQALPWLDDIARQTGSRLLVLLMHWEGTAPWAPPYVWPPYGGEESFNAFADALHQRGHLLGVYCSGFGFTEQSNLIADYHQRDRLAESEVWRGFCAGPDGRIQHSRICTGQRSGYDLCAASAAGQAILNEAYRPLLESKVDYIQILDQNHGGGQYFCYSREHGHAPAPGPWMTASMQKLLTGWQQMGGATLLGCESAAAEPFLPQLLLSDNRFELNYHLGLPVPLYAYLYHEYLHNFMGNQVACGLDGKADTLCLRMAYSFAIGDVMTLVLRQDSEFLPSWGWRDFTVIPSRENVLTLARNLTALYRQKAGSFLADGRMTALPAFECAMMDLPTPRGDLCTLPCVFAAAYEKDDQWAAVLVNHTAEPQQVQLNGSACTVPPLDGVLIMLGAPAPDADRLFRQAVKHIYGDGVPEDNVLALQLLTQAHELGHTDATYHLGVCYHYGHGTAVDLRRAFDLYLTAAKACHGKAMELVGRFYNRGILGKQDRRKAEEWLRKAVESSDPEAAEEARKEFNVNR